MAAAWGTCFSGTLVFLYFFDSHPLNTVFPQAEPFGLTKGMYLAFCLVMTLIGFPAIYFNVRDLRRLRLGNSN